MLPVQRAIAPHGKLPCKAVSCMLRHQSHCGLASLNVLTSKSVMYVMHVCSFDIIGSPQHQACDDGLAAKQGPGPTCTGDSSASIVLRLLRLICDPCIPCAVLDRLLWLVPA